MIISQKKSQEEVLSFLKDCRKVVITGCSLCATTCKVGGEEEILELKAWLEEEGKEVTGYKVLDPACNLLKTTKDLKKMKEELKDADAILSVACGDGTQTVAKAVKIPTYPGVDTMFIGEIERVGQFEESCRACGECELGWTGSICPITRCAKGLVNGPCGGAKDKKCEVNKENDCAWIQIYERMKELGQLEKLMEVRDPKNFQKSNNPRKINLREASKETVEA
ncbi:MAG: methylenetetrahydrofolate reductase C-terminal domain-containing protein [Thermotaleaceae bacterium]